MSLKKNKIISSTYYIPTYIFGAMRTNSRTNYEYEEHYSISQLNHIKHSNVHYTQS